MPSRLRKWEDERGSHNGLGSNRKESVAVVSGGGAIKFASARELLERVPTALVFAEASGPYLQLCELYENYGSIYLVDTGLVARFRKKSDINDAKVLKIAKDYIAGRLSLGVWLFVPDALKKVIGGGRAGY